jgi:CRP/FNR family transcriptional regulator
MAELAEKFGPLLSEDSGDFRDFMQVAAVVELDKGQYVCHEGHACSHLALILDGTARVYKLGENGREITLYRVGPGESCILTASCILSSLPFPAFAVCESRVRAAVIPAAKVQQWLAHWPAWRDYVFGLVARRLTNVISVVEEVAFKRMDRRIADHLLASNKSILHTTHQEIASDLGTSREVVSRILKDLENMNLVEVHRGTVEILAPERLRNI